MDWFTGPETGACGRRTPMRVSELSALIGDLLDDGRLQGIWVRGEITNYTHHSRGHRYFSLSEKGGGAAAAVIRCVMWRSSAGSLSFVPEDGMEVIVAGSVRHYAPHGVYQLQVDEMLRAGIGEKYLLIEHWKQELEREGLFASGRKRPLPAFPGNVGIVTSATGAVIHDVTNVISRRYPLKLVVSPAAMQGDAVQAELPAALSRLAGRVDVIIVARGGGSFEDLFPFNHPAVVRAIASCPVPVVSAIGHEVDVTLADLAADVRAPTPSAAAELVVPDRAFLIERMRDLRNRIAARMITRIEYHREVAENLRERLHPRRFARKIGEREQGLADLADRLQRAFSGRTGRERQTILQLKTALWAGNPLAMLARGYCVVEREGRVVRTVRELAKADRLRVRFADGRSTVIVEEIEYDRNI